MFEFGTRIVLAGALVLIAGTTGFVGLPLAIGIAVIFGALAVASYGFNERGHYDGVGAALHASLEAFVLSVLLVEIHQAEAFGFLAMVPYAWVASRRGAGWASGAFIISFALVAAHSILRGEEPPTFLMIQSAGVLVLGLFLAAKAEVLAPIAEVVPEEDIKGRFRALREAYTVLERRSSDDVHVVAIARATTVEAMAQSVRDATSATGAALFAPADDGWQIVGQAGTIPSDLETPFPNARALQEKGATMIFNSGRPVGAAWLPEESRDAFAGIAEILSSRFGDRMDAESERRKRRAAELRLTLIEGGDSPDAVARAVASLVGADSVQFGAMGPFGATPLGHYGPPCGLPDAIRHSTGSGLVGWSAAGSPMVWISDARSDERVGGPESLRARTAALALVPLADGRAYVWAAWHASGVGRPSALSTMRAAEPTVLRWLARAAAFASDRIAA